MGGGTADPEDTQNDKSHIIVDVSVDSNLVVDTGAGAVAGMAVEEGQ